MILVLLVLKQLMVCFSRTRGGDPRRVVDVLKNELVFPAHAGVILTRGRLMALGICFSRTRGGDPSW